MKKSNQGDYYDKAIKILKDLKKDYPNQDLNKHIALSTFDYRDIFSLTGKEFLFALEKYKAELELNTVSDSDIQKIVNDTTEYYVEDIEEDTESSDFWVGDLND